jgi:hypothetical protein
VSEVGRAALDEQLLRWSPSVRDAPRARRELPPDWEEDVTLPLSIDPEVGNLGDVVERLARFGKGPAPLVLDPLLDSGVRRNVPARRRIPGQVRGPWGVLLGVIVGVQQVSFEVHGWRETGLDGAARARAWVRVCKKGDEGVASGAELLESWVRGVLREHDPRWNAACARALASCGWPAAVAWLEERWTSAGDAAALEGLLLAAGRGRAAPSLAQPWRVRALLRDVDAALAAAAPGSLAFAERGARALAALGPCAADGSALGDVLVEGWEQLGGESRWVRFVAFEGQGRPHVEGRRLARDVLGPAGDPALRLAALGALLRLQGEDVRPITVAAPAALLARAALDGRGDEAARALAAVGARPAPGAAPAADARDDALRLALVEWLALVGAPDDAAAVIGAGVGDGALLEPLAARLRAWTGFGRGALARALVESLRAAGRARDAERLALWSDLLDEEQRRAELDRLLAPGARSAADWLDLGVLAGGPGSGWRARQALVEGIKQEVALEHLRPAVERCVLELRRRRMDEEDGAFQAGLRTQAARARHPLAQVLYGRDWPPRPRETARRLEAFDRRL